jgi:hypothetical protein
MTMAWCPVGRLDLARDRAGDDDIDIRGSTAVRLS